MTDAPKPKLRWFQFSLRTLLVFVTLCAVPCSWLGVKMQKARQQRKAARAIEELGGEVGWSEPSGPAWLRSLLGDDVFRHVDSVDAFVSDVDDAALENLKALNQVEYLGLVVSPVTDAGLEHLKGLNRLQTLIILEDTDITDAGLAHLKTLTQLEYLCLYATKVTDAGLENLTALKKLQRLDLGRTKVTDVGLEKLTGLDKLQRLNLGGTKVTDAGVKKLQQALPNCTVEFTVMPARCFLGE